MMKRILCILFILCVIDLAAMAQGAPPLRIREADGSPNKLGISTIVVTNGTLTISGTTATIVTGGGGGGGSPGGSTTQVQYNDTGAFAGAAGFTFNGTSTVTLGVAGTSVGAIAFKNATSGTITLQPVTGALGTVTLSLPAATDTLVGLAATQTLTNKTLTAPVIATISNTGTLTLPTSTDTLVGKATTDTFTNKTLTSSTNVLGGVTMTLGSDADGDIYYRSSNVLTRLPKGTALQVLRMNAGATAPEWAAASGGSGITIGSTTITSGTNTRVLYNNAGVVGEYEVTGTGNAVLSASPTLTGTVGAAAATFSGTIVQTSASATAFESGPNGSTNPVFRLVNSTASAATGLAITGNAAGSGVTLTALSSGTNEDLRLVTKGTGIVQVTPGSAADIVFRTNYSDGTARFQLGTYPGVNSLSMVWMASITPSTSNYTLISDGSAELGVNVQNSTGSIYFRAGNSNKLLRLNGSGGAGTAIATLPSGGQFGFTSSSNTDSGFDTILRRAAAANFAFGATDAASPVAQTLSVQNVVAGTSNAAGATLTEIASLGTSQGAPGRFHLQAGAMIAASGTTQQTAVDRLVVGATKVLTNNSAITIANVTVAAGTSAGGVLRYCVEVTDGTDTQYECGSTTFGVSNKGGVFSGNTATKFGNHQNVTAGTLAVTFAISGANPALLSVNANSSLTPSTGYPRIAYSIENFGQQALAVQ